MTQKEEMKDCSKCSISVVLANKITELEKENKELREDQELTFLTLNLFLDAVKLWGQQHGLIETEEGCDDSMANKDENAINKKMTDFLAVLNRASV